MRVWFDDALLDSAFHASSHRCPFFSLSNLLSLHSPLCTWYYCWRCYSIYSSITACGLYLEEEEEMCSDYHTKSPLYCSCTEEERWHKLSQRLLIRNWNPVFCRLPEPPELRDKCMIMIVLLFRMTLNFNVKYTHCPRTPLIFIPSLLDPHSRSHVEVFDVPKLSTGPFGVSDPELRFHVSNTPDVVTPSKFFITSRLRFRRYHYWPCAKKIGILVRELPVSEVYSHYEAVR